MDKCPGPFLLLFLCGALLWEVPLARSAEWVVIAVTGEAPRVMSAERVDEQGAMVTLRDAGGRALGAWQKVFVLERIVQPPAERSAWEVEAMRSRLVEWEAFLARHSIAEPVVGPVLKEVRAFVKFQDDQAAEAQAQKQRLLQSRIEAALAVPLPSKEPAPDGEMIQNHIREVRTLITEWPEGASKLQEHLKPWEEMGEALKAGKAWFEGAWKTPQEIEAIKEDRLMKEREAAMEKAARMEIAATVIPAEMMGKVQIGVLASFGLGVLALPVLLFWRATSTTVIRTQSQGDVRLKHSGGWLEGFKILLFLASLGLVAIEGYYIYRLWFAPTGAEALVVEPASSPDFLKGIYACSHPQDLKMADVPREIRLPDTTLNAHLSKYLVFTGGGQTDSLERTSWSVIADEQSIRILENLRCSGRAWTATYIIELSNDAGGMRFRSGRVLIDGIQVPQILGGLLWNSFQSELRAWGEKSAVSQHYQFAGVEENKLLLRMTMMPPVQP